RWPRGVRAVARLLDQDGAPRLVGALADEGPAARGSAGRGLRRRLGAVVPAGAGVIVIRVPVARLRVARRPVLVLPLRVLLRDQPDLGVGPDQVRVVAAGRAQVLDERLDPR